MTHQFLLRFSNPEDQQAARNKLQSLTLDGAGVIGFSDSDSLSLYFGCQLRTVVDVDQTVVSQDDLVREFRLGDYFYKMEALKSGRHHPDGCLWIQSDQPQVVAEKVSVLDVFPTISSMFGISHDGVKGQPLRV